jgi:sodium/pantothenate symporter
MDIYSGAVLLSLIVYIAVGNYAGRRVKKLDDYFVAGRHTPTLLIVGPLVVLPTAWIAWRMIKKSYG